MKRLDYLAINDSRDFFSCRQFIKTCANKMILYIIITTITFPGAFKNVLLWTTYQPLSC